MTIETDINVMEHAGRAWRFTLKNERGEVLPPDGFVFYGAAGCPGQLRRVFKVLVVDGVAEVRMPGLPVCDWPWQYQIFAQEVGSGVEWLICSGTVNVVPRVACGHDALSPELEEYAVVLDSTTQEITIELGDSTVSVAENARRAAQAAQDSLAAKDDAVMAKDGAVMAKGDAEKAAGEAEQSAANASRSLNGAKAFARGAEEEADRADAAADKASQHEETVRGLITDAAAHEQAAAESARDALANKQGAEQAVQDAALAQVAARQHAQDSETASQTATQKATEASSSANAAAADKAAAEKAKQEALAAQSTVEEQADIATKAAEQATDFLGLATASAPIDSARFEYVECIDELELLAADMMDTTCWRYPLPALKRVGEKRFGDIFPKLKNLLIQFDGETFENPEKTDIVGTLELENLYVIAKNIKGGLIFLLGDIKAKNVYCYTPRYQLAICKNTVVSDTLWFYNEFPTILPDNGYSVKPVKNLIIAWTRHSSILCSYLGGMQKIYCKLPNASNVDFVNAQMDKASVFRITDSIPAWNNGVTHELKLGIHVDLKTDEEVLAALALVDIAQTPIDDGGKGWTLTIRWNGTPTAQTAGTFAMGSLIYAKVSERELSDGTTERVLDWGHYVTDPTGYETFRSLASAYEYFGLEMPEAEHGGL